VIVDRLHLSNGVYLTRLGLVETGDPAPLDVDWATVSHDRPVEAAHWVRLARSVGVDLGDLPEPVAAAVERMEQP
jgi:hypothetical protein